jgi:hypothetical protein
MIKALEFLTKRKKTMIRDTNKDWSKIAEDNRY